MAFCVAYARCIAFASYGYSYHLPILAGIVVSLERTTVSILRSAASTG
jgi:hypothetical protein